MSANDATSRPHPGRSAFLAAAALSLSAMGTAAATPTPAPDERVVRMASLSPNHLSEFDTRAPDLVWQPLIYLDKVPAQYDGRGVTVAMIDTGVTQVPDLGNRLLARVDFTEDRDGIDRYGHGTHMAGLIAGDGSGSGGQWKGAAPGANLVSLKVASWNGASDVSTVMGALQWVVSNKSRFNIRVVNLSFGTDGRQSYLTDPLDRAVERVTDAGILVVTAAGNGGSAPGSISKPADDPKVLTVGAFDNAGTLIELDDGIPTFSGRGPTQDGLAKPDLVGPGVSMVSNRAPGTTIDEFHPAARLGEKYFKGTGTSQAAAVLSGIAARVISAKPSLTPDRVKAILIATANDELEVPGGGAGRVNPRDAVEVALGLRNRPVTIVNSAPSNGLGTIQGSRGNAQVYADVNRDGIPELVNGAIDVLGNRFVASTWATGAWTASTWASSPWSRATEAPGWAPVAAGTAFWKGAAPDAVSWAARNWTAAGWTARNWTARNWTAGLWG